MNLFIKFIFSLIELFKTLVLNDFIFYKIGYILLNTSCIQYIFTCLHIFLFIFYCIKKLIIHDIQKGKSKMMHDMFYHLITKLHHEISNFKIQLQRSGSKHGKLISHQFSIIH